MNDFILVHLNHNNISILIRISNIEEVSTEPEFGSCINLKNNMTYIVKESVEEIFKMITGCQE